MNKLFTSLSIRHKNLCAVKQNIGQTIDFYSYLPDDFLVKVDRASMYNSLEARVPYLDNDVIDFAYSSKNTHVNLLKTKVQLRRLIKEKLPEISKRPKKGFGMPLEKWLRGPLKDLAYRSLTNKQLDDYLDRTKITEIWEDHQKRVSNNGGAIWQLIIFSEWLRNYM